MKITIKDREYGVEWVWGMCLSVDYYAAERFQNYTGMMNIPWCIFIHIGPLFFFSDKEGNQEEV